MARPQPKVRRAPRFRLPSRPQTALQELGWDFWAMALVIVGALAYGIFALTRPADPNRITPILGYREVAPPASSRE
jgi:hypothetical protein